LRDLEAIGLIVKIKTGNIRSEMLRGKIRAGGRASEFLYLGAIEPLRQLKAFAQTKRGAKPILRSLT